MISAIESNRTLYSHHSTIYRSIYFVPNSLERETTAASDVSQWESFALTF